MVLLYSEASSRSIKRFITIFGAPSKNLKLKVEDRSLPYHITQIHLNASRGVVASKEWFRMDASKAGAKVRAVVIIRGFDK